MASARFDIEIEEHSNITYSFVYKDENGDPIDVTNYGATILFAKDRDSEPFAVGDHSDGWVTVGTTDGKFVLNVPYTEFVNMDIERGVWEMYIYPTANDITDRPKRLVMGSFEYIKGLL